MSLCTYRRVKRPGIKLSVTECYWVSSNNRYYVASSCRRVYLNLKLHIMVTNFAVIPNDSSIIVYSYTGTFYKDVTVHSGLC